MYTHSNNYVHVYNIIDCLRSKCIYTIIYYLLTSERENITNKISMCYCRLINMYDTEVCTSGNIKVIGDEYHYILICP